MHVRYQGNEFRVFLTYGPRGAVTRVQWKRVKGNLTAQVKAKAEALFHARSCDILKKLNDIHILHKHVKPLPILRLN